MSLAYRQPIFVVPRGKNARADDPHGIGRSPRFMPGWWIAGVAAFYTAVAALCIFVL